MKILFVCTGNTCRSPMAEALARQIAEEQGYGDMEFYSAGIYASEDRVSKEAAAEMMKRGIDIDRRRAVQVTKNIVADFDLTLTMTAEQAAYLRSELPDYAQRIYSIGEYTGTNEDIPDPYGLGQYAYEECAARLEQYCELILRQPQ